MDIWDLTAWQTEGELAAGSYQRIFGEHVAESESMEGRIFLEENALERFVSGHNQIFCKFANFSISFFIPWR